MVYLPTFTIKSNQPWLQWILWILWVTRAELHGNYYPIVPMFCQLPEGLKTLYDPCARATSREKVAPIWMARNKWVTEVIALLIRFIGAPFIIRAHLVWKGGQDLTAAFCKLRLLATTKTTTANSKKIICALSFYPNVSGEWRRRRRRLRQHVFPGFLAWKGPPFTPGRANKKDENKYWPFAENIRGESSPFFHHHLGVF